MISNLYISKIWSLKELTILEKRRYISSKTFNDKFNDVTVYLPSDIVHFGKYKGEDWRFVYMFDPEYIEFLIDRKDWFAID